jgi:hypothetical protein
MTVTHCLRLHEGGICLVSSASANFKVPKMGTPFPLSPLLQFLQDASLPKTRI